MASVGCGIGKAAMHCWSSFGKNHCTAHMHVLPLSQNVSFPCHQVWRCNNFLQTQWDSRQFGL